MFAGLFLAVFASFACGQATPSTSQAPTAPRSDSNSTEQAPASSTPIDQAPGLKTNVDEVSLDIVVHDKQHSAVLNLKPEDLVVTDNGAQVKLTGFHLVGANAAASTGHMITLVFDSFHGAIAKNTRNVAQKVLGVLPTTGYSVSVLDIKGRLRLIQGFTEDRHTVEQAVNVVTESQPIVLSSTHSEAINIVNDQMAEEGKAKAASEAEKNLIAVAQTGIDVSGRPVNAKERARALSLLTALNDMQSIVQERQPVQLNLASLLALVKSQERIADRKVLIYFTQNSQLDKTAKAMLKTIADAAAQSGVSIYTVDMDALGNSTQYQMTNLLLNGQRPYSPAKTDSVTLKNGTTVAVSPPQQEGGAPISGDPSSTGRVWGPAQDLAVMADFMRGNNESTENPFNDTKNPLAGMSKETGGAYIDGQSNPKKPLQQMVQDLSTYYQATYVPPFKTYDGKFRSIAVKPMRAGLNIQTKTGYFAVAPGAIAGIRPFELPLIKTLADTQLPSDIKFHAAVLRFGELPDGNTNTLAVEVPLSELKTRQDGNSKLTSAHVSIVAQIKDSNGVVVEHYGDDITKQAARETLDRDPFAAVSLERHFNSAPGRYTMEVAVLDQNSGKDGAQRTDFEVPNSPAAVALSDIVLVRGMGGSHVDDDDPLEPLRYEHERVTPNITGELPENAKGVSLFFLLHPDPSSNDAMTLEMQVIHNNKAGKRLTLLQMEGVHAATPYLASFGSSKLSAGEYEIKAYLSQGGKTSEQSKKFMVGGVPGTETAVNDLKWIEGAGISPGKESYPVVPTPEPSVKLPLVVPAAPFPVPVVDEARSLIDAARQHALNYNELLPNFMCTEVTKRSVDVNGDGRWRLRDTLVEMVRFREKTETHTMLEVNGKASSMDRESMKGALSAGEFGGVLQAVFQKESRADFQWKETESLNGDAVQVFNYRVDPANSVFSLWGSNGKKLVVGFHGQVFIDGSSQRVRRITLVADELPPDFPTRATIIGVDYDYVPINGLRYLMPVSAELQLRQGQHEAVINTMEFKDYERFEPM
jgi:VWFA-related protein